MAKISKQIVDKDLRERVFDMLINVSIDEAIERADDSPFVKINDRQYGVLLTDANGEQRYIRIGAIVAELREDMTAEELMQSEIKAYQDKVNARAEKAKEKEKKIAEDKAKREAKAKAEAEKTEVSES